LLALWRKARKGAVIEHPLVTKQMPNANFWAEQLVKEHVVDAEATPVPLQTQYVLVGAHAPDLKPHTEAAAVQTPVIARAVALKQEVPSTQ